MGSPECTPAWEPLRDKTLLFGVTGGIAACKAAEYARGLSGLGARVIPVMTGHAAEFVTPLTFAALTGSRVYTGLFEKEGAEAVSHIKLARSADLFLVLPATANILAKAASGIADDLLSTMLLAYEGAVLFFPSMNPAMYAHPATRANLERLRKFGYGVVEPGQGRVACGETGRGRLAEWRVVVQESVKAVTPQRLLGKTVLVSAGPTREPVDPVRFVSNRSSGRMGHAVASAAYRRGARVHLVCGPVSVEPPHGAQLHFVERAKEMEKKMKELSAHADIVVMAAAVADYAPGSPSAHKIKKDAAEMVLRLEKTRDILSDLVKERRKGQVVVGFCAETRDLEQQAIAKTRRKGVDLMVANDVSRPDAGFDVRTNRVLLVYRDGTVEPLPLMLKEAVAEAIWDRIERLV